MKKVIDLSGQIFGIYLVLKEDEELTKEKKKKYWICECQKCKNIISVRTDGLKRLPKSCPNCKNDITGQKFGKLTALYRTKLDKNGHSYWMCQCECGNQKEIASSNLKDGKTTSCGCYHKQIISEKYLKNIIGQKFGKLTVLKREGEIGEKVKYLCQCECGSQVIVNYKNLQSGHTTSCGCIRSKGELKIREILNILKISYKTEYIFKNQPNRRYDFYLPEYNTCIEFHGKQHYTYVNSWHKNFEEFEKAKNRDQEKIDFCIKNNIKLIIIPYYDYDKLNENYLLNLIKSAGEI